MQLYFYKLMKIKLIITKKNNIFIFMFFFHYLVIKRICYQYHIKIKKKKTKNLTNFKV